MFSDYFVPVTLNKISHSTVNFSDLTKSVGQNAAQQMGIILVVSGLLWLLLVFNQNYYYFMFHRCNSLDFVVTILSSMKFSSSNYPY